MLSRDEERERRHRWKVRSLFAFGVLVWVSGGVTGDGDLTYQGCLITTVVIAYWWTMVMRRRPGPPPREGRSRRRPGLW